MVDYNYTDIENQPNIATYEKDAEGNLILVSGIEYDVAHSEMTDKGMICGTWWKDTETLKLTFTNTLSSSDKNILDAIVLASEV